MYQRFLERKRFLNKRIAFAVVICLLFDLVAVYLLGKFVLPYVHFAVLPLCLLISISIQSYLTFTVVMRPRMMTPEFVDDYELQRLSDILASLHKEYGFPTAVALISGVIDISTSSRLKLLGTAGHIPSPFHEPTVWMSYELLNEVSDEELMCISAHELAHMEQSKIHILTRLVGFSRGVLGKLVASLSTYALFSLLIQMAWWNLFLVLCFLVLYFLLFVIWAQPYAYLCRLIEFRTDLLAAWRLRDFLNDKQEQFIDAIEKTTDVVQSCMENPELKVDTVLHPEISLRRKQIRELFS